MKLKFTTPKKLREAGVLGMNERNAGVIMEMNPRSGYQLVDNKLVTKQAAEKAKLPIPPTYGVVEMIQETKLSKVANVLGQRTSFVIKPARGAGGKGVLVIKSRRHNTFFKPSGQPVSLKDIRIHLSQTLGGVYSLGGHRDVALIEYRVKSASEFNKLSYQGAPDLRVILCKGEILLAMVRSATSESDGKANLHQGGIGIGVDLESGQTTYAFRKGEYIEEHPDTGEPLTGVQVPFWSEVKDLANRAAEMSELGYIGVDIMIDSDLGPVLIEMNARPGLAIQLANKQGLSPLIQALR